MKKEKYKIGAPGKTVIGLTGPIASGKSLALSYFKKHGAFCVSADALAASLLTEPPCYNRILRKFGPEILLKNGFLDKKRLAAEVFGSAAKRKWLERLLHPVILKETHSLITKSHKKFAVVEAPLLFEAGLAECFALNLCLYAPERTLEARALGPVGQGRSTGPGGRHKCRRGRNTPGPRWSWTIRAIRPRWREA